MSYSFVNVQRFKRGASWPDGTPRMCTRCDLRTRRSQAVVVAEMKYAGSKFAVPVGYCADHAPDRIGAA